MLYESLIPFPVSRLIPSENLIDLAKDHQGPRAIEFGRHDRPTLNPQVRQANQGRSLPVFELS